MLISRNVDQPKSADPYPNQTTLRTNTRHRASALDLLDLRNAECRFVLGRIYLCFVSLWHVVVGFHRSDQGNGAACTAIATRLLRRFFVIEGHFDRAVKPHVFFRQNHLTSR